MTGGGYVTFPPELTVDEALARLRATAREVEILHTLYVVDERERLLGVLSIRELLAGDGAEPLGKAMVSPVRSVPPDAPSAEVAETMSKYDLLALPVTGPEGELLGLITIDDVVDYLQPAARARRRRLL